MKLLEISLFAIYTPRTIKKLPTELMNDIKLKGLVEPIVVKRVKNGRFKLLDGACRVMACKELGHKTILAYVREE